MPEATPAPTAKPIYQSKTFWLQIITLAAAFFPPVQAFLIANPITSVGALTAVNLLVRFVTNGKITIFADGTDASANQSGTTSGGALLLAITVTAAGIMGCLPSCTAANWAAIKSIPIKAGFTSPYGTANYSSKTGLDVAVVQPVPAVEAASGK